MLKEILTQNKDRLIEIIIKDFMDKAFDNRFTMHPRKIKEIGKEEVLLLIDFVSSNDMNRVFSHGEKRAHEGFGEKPLFSLAANIRKMVVEKTIEIDCNNVLPALSIIDDYFNTYFTGYLSGKEKHILFEQEKLRISFNTVYGVRAPVK